MLVASSTGCLKNNQHGEATSLTYLTTPPSSAESPVSPAFALDFAELSAIWGTTRDHSEVQLKRELWGKLLTTALGTNFTDTDRLFIEHTYLVVAAEIIAHAVIGFDPADPSLGPATLVTGQAFASAQIHGVVEADFFDWVLEAPGGRLPRSSQTSLFILTTGPLCSQRSPYSVNCMIRIGTTFGDTMFGTWFVRFG